MIDSLISGFVFVFYGMILLAVCRYYGIRYQASFDVKMVGDGASKKKNVKGHEHEERMALLS